jgi:hypothetical protein
MENDGADLEQIISLSREGMATELSIRDKFFIAIIPNMLDTYEYETAIDMAMMLVNKIMDARNGD